MTSRGGVWKIGCLLAAAGWLLAGGCRLKLDTAIVQSCEGNEDCPDFYHCVVAFADGGMACEVIFPPRMIVDGGGPFYCGEVKAALDRTCIANCHGEDTAGSLGQDTFRLDYYTPTDGGLPGAYEQAARIKVRMSDFKDMPPQSAPSQPTLEERALVGLWVLQGAQLCAADGGVADAGVVVSDTGRYALEVQPVWNQRCAPCHITDNPRAGDLNLNGLTSYNALVGVPSTCDASLPRVTPGNTEQSALWRKLQKSALVCGGYPATMPRLPNGTSLDGGLKDNFPADFQKVEQWISDGAPAN